MTSTKFVLTKLNCEACVKVSRLKIGKIDGVIKVELKQRGSEAEGEVEAERGITIEEIRGSLAGTPYEVRAV